LAQEPWAQGNGVAEGFGAFMLAPAAGTHALQVRHCLLLFAACAGLAQDVAGVDYTNTTATSVTSTTSITTVSTSTTTTTTRDSCTSLVCPDGFAPKANHAELRCGSGVCDVASDRDLCCDELCPGQMRCPYYFFPKANDNGSLQCTGLCDQETDIDTCCDEAESCANFSCPGAFLAKDFMADFRCVGVKCDPVEDVSSCCDEGCAEFACPSGATVRATSRCDGRCHAIMDRGTCCSFAVAADAAAQLINAARTSDALRVARLGAMRADPLARDSAGSSALHHAALHGHAEVLGLLLGQRADLHGADGQGWTPLHTAAARGHEAAVAFLVSARADPSMRTPPPGQLKALQLFSRVAGAAAAPSAAPDPVHHPVLLLLVEAERARAEAANVGQWPYHVDDHSAYHVSGEL